MNIIGCDLHTRYQVVAWMDEETGEIRARRLEHGKEEVRAFYARLPRGARIGIEATLPALWFERLLAQHGHELWVGTRRRSGRKRCGSRRRTAAMPSCYWCCCSRIVSRASGCHRRRSAMCGQLLMHRMKLVRVRTLVKNQLHALAMSQGVCRKRKLWSEKGRVELESLMLLPWASRRRKELLAWLDPLDAAIQPLDRAVEEEAERRAEAVLLMTHPGVGAVVRLAFVLAVGPVERFADSWKLVIYLGLNPREHSSGGRQRLGAISKQRNTMLRWLLVQAAQTAAWGDEKLRRVYQRLKIRRVSGVAKVAIARPSADGCGCTGCCAGA